MPKQLVQEKESREEIANTIKWARSGEMNAKRAAKEYKLTTRNMSKQEKSNLLH